jgi:hypothetical protein
MTINLMQSGREKACLQETGISACKADPEDQKK